MKYVIRIMAQIIIALSIMILGRFNILNGLENWFGFLVYLVMWTIGWIIYDSTFE